MKSLRIKKMTVTAGRPSGSRVAGALRLSVVAAGVLLCAAVSCKKDEGGEPAPIYGVKTFHASSEGHTGNGKTTLDNKTVLWEEGDEAAVHGSENENGAYSKYVATEPHGNETDYYYADGDEASGSEFYAVYPYSAVSENFGETESGKWKVSLPKYQVGSEAGTFASGANVMAARSNDLALKFKNLCGVLRLKLKSTVLSNVKVKSIQVVSKTSSENLWGSGYVTFGEVNGTHTLGDLEGGDNDVYLVYPNGVALTADDEGTEFDLVIPAGKLAGGFSLEVYCEWDGGKKGMFFTGTTNASTMIYQNRITVMPVVDIKDYIKEGVLPGRFSVSTTKQVHFSQGNLQFHTTDKVWRFADNQYDRIDVTAGEHAAVGYSDNSGKWIDLYCCPIKTENE